MLVDSLSLAKKAKRVFYNSSSKKRAISANQIVGRQHAGVLSMAEWTFVNECLLSVKKKGRSY